MEPDMAGKRQTSDKPEQNGPRTPHAPADGSRSEFVYRSLIDAIRSGTFAPGYRIREEELARNLGVSRTPVREAIQLLQARRLVEQVSGRGLSIAELTMQQVIELYAMREVLEGAAARFAAQHANPTEILIMRSYIEEFKAAEGDSKRLAAANRALHKIIYEAARNRYMQEALSTLEDSLSLLRSTTFSLPQRFAAAMEEHLAIVDAIERRDPDKAEERSRYHIREAQRARLTMLMSR